MLLGSPPWPGHLPGRGLLLSSGRRQQLPRLCPAQPPKRPPRAQRAGGRWGLGCLDRRRKTQLHWGDEERVGALKPSFTHQAPFSTAWGWPCRRPTLGEGHWPGVWSPWVPFKSGQGEGGRRCWEAPHAPGEQTAHTRHPLPGPQAGRRALPYSLAPGPAWLVAAAPQAALPSGEAAALISRLVQGGLVAGL